MWQQEQGTNITFNLFSGTLFMYKKALKKINFKIVFSILWFFPDKRIKKENFLFSPLTVVADIHETFTLDKLQNHKFLKKTFLNTFRT